MQPRQDISRPIRRTTIGCVRFFSAHSFRRPCYSRILSGLDQDARPGPAQPETESNEMLLCTVRRLPHVRAEQNSAPSLDRASSHAGGKARQIDAAGRVVNEARRAASAGVLEKVVPPLLVEL